MAASTSDRLLPDDGTTASELIGRARAAAERRAGTGRTTWSSTRLHEPLGVELLTLEQSLRDALRNEELVKFAYQPRVDIETQEIIWMEALVR